MVEEGPIHLHVCRDCGADGFVDNASYQSLQRQLQLTRMEFVYFKANQHIKRTGHIIDFDNSRCTVCGWFPILFSTFSALDGS